MLVSCENYDLESVLRASVICTLNWMRECVINEKEMYLVRYVDDKMIGLTCLLVVSVTYCGVKIR